MTNFSTHASNDAHARTHKRERTVPIPESVIHVPGYPEKLSIFKMQASKFWQVRCWHNGKTYRKSTKSQSMRSALIFARIFYEQLMACNVKHDTSLFVNSKSSEKSVNARNSFGMLAAKMYTNESARVKRGEYTKGSLQVLRNRLDAHLLPRWGATDIKAIDYAELLKFIQEISDKFSTITISQYMVIIKKVFTLASALNMLDKIPAMPKVKVKTVSRGSFTPSEYWKIIRSARRLVGKVHPEHSDLRKCYRLRTAENIMPVDLQWAIRFMVNSFIRPSDLKTLKHKHIEIAQKDGHTYLRLTLPETKSHSSPIATLLPAVTVYKSIVAHYRHQNLAEPDDYIFLPSLRDRNYAHWVLSFFFNWVLAETGLKQGANGQDRSLYSLRHSAITFRLLFGDGIDLLTLARNARTSVKMIEQFYTSQLSGEMNISMLQRKRK
jgi:integrase